MYLLNEAQYCFSSLASTSPLYHNANTKRTHSKYSGVIQFPLHFYNVGHVVLKHQCFNVRLPSSLLLFVHCFDKEKSKSSMDKKPKNFGLTLESIAEALLLNYTVSNIVRERVGGKLQKKSHWSTTPVTVIFQISLASIRQAVNLFQMAHWQKHQFQCCVTPIYEWLWVLLL